MGKAHGRTPLEDLAARAVDDWVSAAEVYEIAARTGVTEPARIRATAIGLVADAIHRGLVVAGWVEHTGHWPWDCSPFDAIGRLASDWFARPNPRPRQGEMFWLDNAPAGKALGLEVLERERLGREIGPSTSPAVPVNQASSQRGSSVHDPATHRWIDTLSAVVGRLDHDLDYWLDDDMAEVARAATAKGAERPLCAAALHVLERGEGAYFEVLSYLAFRFQWPRSRQLAKNPGRPLNRAL